MKNLYRIFVLLIAIICMTVFVTDHAGATVCPGVGCDYSSTPVGNVASGGINSGSMYDTFQGTLAPGRGVYVPPSGAPTTWTGEAEGSVWKAAQVAGQAPLPRNWGLVKWGGAAILQAGAFQAGLYLGGVIAKRFIFDGNPPSVPTSGLVTSLTPNWSANFVTVASAQPQSQMANVPANSEVLVFNGDWYGGSPGNDLPDLSVCNSYAIGTLGYSGGVCTYDSDTRKSNEIQNYNTAMTLKDTGLWHLASSGQHVPTGTYPTGLVLYASEAEFAQFMKAHPDPDHNTAQTGDTIISNFTPVTFTNTLTKAGAQSEIDDCQNSGNCGAVQRTNCEMDASYCPGGVNDPNAIGLLKPLVNETYSDYIARLTAAGFVGTITDTEETSDKDGYGPNAVTRVVVGTGVDQQVFDPLQWPAINPNVEASDQIIVRHNSASATPAPTTGTNTGCGSSISSPCYSADATPDPTESETYTGPTVPTASIDWTPIQNIDVGTKFPFGAIQYITGFIGWFNVTPQCPGFAIDVPGVGGDHPINSPGTYSGNLCFANTYMSWVRTMISVVLWIGAVWFVATRLMKWNWSGDMSDAADDGAVF